MLPISSVDQVQCLQSLMGIRTGCSVEKNYPFWIEDIEGVDIPKLAKISKGSNGTGKDFANQLINSAAREMLADIETMLNNGFKLKEMVGDICSACSILPVYTANSGIKVTSAIASRFKTLRITKLSMMINQSGPFQIVIDDGKNPVYYTPTFVAGVLTPVNIDYVTPEKSVTIYFSDNTVGLGQVSCATPSSCGCGKSSISDNPVTVTGIVGGVDTTTQYGFLPCAAIGCSYDTLVCSLIKQTPNIFGITLFYKTGEKYYLHKFASERNNDSASYNEEEKPELIRNYTKLYKESIYGTAARIGLKKVVNDYLKDHNKDRCVVCDAKVMTAYAVG